MIAQIIELLLKIFAEWPQRQKEAASKKWSAFRNTYEKDKEERARRASLITSIIMRDSSKNKLQ